MGLFDLSDVTEAEEIEIETEDLCAECGGSIVTSRCLQRKSRHVYRRAFSETQLLDILPHTLEIGTSYHCISGGDIDSLSYLKHVLRQQALDYLLLSTWCMADDDVLQLKAWVDSGRIGRLDCYCGEIFPGSYKKQYDGLKKVVDSCNGRVAIFKNHSKIFAGTGDSFAFAIESSANINTNPRTENTTITIDAEAFDFYKGFYDGIKSFTRDYTQWKPWIPQKKR